MFDSRSLCVFQTFFALETILFSRIDILPLLAIARYWRPNKGKEKRNFQHKMKHVLIITKNRYSTQQSFWISGGKKSMSVFSFRIRNNFSCCSHLSICSYLYYSNWQIMQLQATLKGKRSKKKSFFSARKKEIKPENAKAMSNWFRNATTWNTRTMAMQVKYLIRYNISVVAVFSVRFFSFSSIYYHFAYLHAQIK